MTRVIDILFLVYSCSGYAVTWFLHNPALLTQIQSAKYSRPSTSVWPTKRCDIKYIVTYILLDVILLLNTSDMVPEGFNLLENEWEQEKKDTSSNI